MLTKLYRKYYIVKDPVISFYLLYIGSYFLGLETGTQVSSNDGGNGGAHISIVVPYSLCPY